VRCDRYDPRRHHQGEVRRVHRGDGHERARSMRSRYRQSPISELTPDRYAVSFDFADQLVFEEPVRARG
jgi:hypothetical protein